MNKTSNQIKSDDCIFLITGDIVLGGNFLYLKEQNQYGWDYPFDKVQFTFGQADVVFGNLECPLSKKGVPRVDKSSILYSPIESVEALRYLNYNVLCLSNNHITDYGIDGLVETTRILDQENFLHFGAGSTINEANNFIIIEKKGLKIGFLGYTTNEKNVNSIIADEQNCGCVLYDINRIVSDINELKTKSDIICISLHWGYEFYDYPSPTQIELAHAIIDAGAHFVIGHHPHVIQGFEQYKHGVILYSLGNFFFPDFYRKNGTLHKWNDVNKRSIIAKCTIDLEKKIEVSFYYGYMDESYKVEFLDGVEKERIKHKFESISNNLKMENYTSFWMEYDETKRKELDKIYNSSNLSTLVHTIHKLGFKGFLNKISYSNIVSGAKILFKYIHFKIY